MVLLVVSLSAGYFQTRLKDGKTRMAMCIVISRLSQKILIPVQSI